MGKNVIKMRKFDPATLVQRRQQNSMSQLALAASIGELRGKPMDTQIISKWERGLVVPSGENLAAISAALNSPIDAFFV